jgi:hypothetical protein
VAAKQVALEQVRLPALAGRRHNLRALGRNLLGGRVGQVAQRLPADRRVGIEQPVYDRALWPGDVPFVGIRRHVLLPPSGGDTTLGAQRVDNTFNLPDMRLFVVCQPLGIRLHGSFPWLARARHQRHP